MATLTSHYYQRHYRPIQMVKYQGSWPLIQPHLPALIPSMLDLGIGYGWWEGFLAAKRVKVGRIVGVDLDEEAVSPRREKVDYVLGPVFRSPELFDVVVSWDAFHVLKNKKVWDLVQPGGLLLVSEPKPFAHLLDSLMKKKSVVVDAWVGQTEQSRVVLARKNFL